MSATSELEFIPAKSAAEATARIFSLTGSQPSQSRGEKRAILALRDSLGLDIPAVETNATMGAMIARELGLEWITSEYENRNMLSLDGINALLFGASVALQEGSLRRIKSTLPTQLDDPEWATFEPAVSKLEAVTRIASLTGSGPERLGPGSKEHKSVLTNLAAKLLPHLDRQGLSKTRLAESIAVELGVLWGDDLISTGETILLSGLNVILAGAERRLGRLGSAYAAGLSPAGEGSALVDALWQRLLSSGQRRWDGADAVKWLKDQGTRQENQMEWPGFYFEHLGRKILGGTFRPNPSPPVVRFGNTFFDFSLNHVWDLKAHTRAQLDPLTGISRNQSPDTPLNDADAVRACVESQGLGFLVLNGEAILDASGLFKAWHDAFKGRPSAPSLSGRSRARKAAFVPQSVEAFWIPNTPALDAALASGALKVSVQGRQQSGAARRDKIHMNVVRAASSLRVAERVFAQ